MAPSHGLSGPSLRERNGLLIGDLRDIGQAMRTQMEQLKETIAAIGETVGLVEARRRAL